MIIAITGTPGCGKTTISKKLSKLLKYNYVDVNKLVKANKIYSGYDKKRKSYIVDIVDLERFFKKFLKNKKNVILDGHLSHYLHPDMVVVLRCNIKELEKRMRKKRWNNEKIKENLEAELIGLISYESRQLNKRVFDVDVTNKNINKTVNYIKNLMKIKTSNKQIDWIK